MARTKSTTPAAPMIDRFTYTPGDGYRYRWDGPVIVVERIVTDLINDTITFEPTGDTIPVPAAITATAMARQVDGWRQATRT